MTITVAQKHLSRLLFAAFQPLLRALESSASQASGALRVGRAIAGERRTPAVEHFDRNAAWIRVS
jgi:hypothetical protein